MRKTIASTRTTRRYLYAALATGAALLFASPAAANDCGYENPYCETTTTIEEQPSTTITSTTEPTSTTSVPPATSSTITASTTTAALETTSSTSLPSTSSSTSSPTSSTVSPTTSSSVALIEPPLQRPPDEPIALDCTTGVVVNGVCQPAGVGIPATGWSPWTLLGAAFLAVGFGWMIANGFKRR